MVSVSLPLPLVRGGRQERAVWLVEGRLLLKRLCHGGETVLRVQLSGWAAVLLAVAKRSEAL